MRTRIRRAGVGLVALVPLLMLPACTAQRTGDESASRGRAPGMPATFGQYDASGASGGPGRGVRYGLGAPASEQDIAQWNTDVGPDGTGLPSGSGSVAEGETIFAAKCAVCHGAEGVGGIAPNPALVGRDSAAEGFRFANDPKLIKTIGNYWPYASTLFDYIKRAMPLAASGTLADHEVYALTAYLLSMNGIVPAPATMTAETLRAVKMPYADRFVPDDRRGGAEIR